MVRGRVLLVGHGGSGEIDAALRARFSIIAAGLADAVSLVSRHECDVLVLGVPASEPGLDAVGRILQLRPGIGVVLTLCDACDDLVIDSVCRGVQGLVLANACPEAVVACVATVLAGGMWLDPVLVRGALQRFVARHAVLLGIDADVSARERQVIALVGRGLTNKEIGARLFVSEGTVKAHLYNIFRKLDVRSRRALADYAREHGLG